MRFIDQVRVPIPAKTEHIRRKYLDLSYDEGFYRRKLDIYLPNEGEGPFPVIVDIHGGGWYFGDKSEHKLDPALHLLDRGYAVVSVGLFPELDEKAAYTGFRSESCHPLPEGTCR